MNILTRYTLKYLRLNKKRTAVTILGVILSSALLCGVILLGVSFQKLMIDLFFYGFLTLITLIGVTNIVNTLDTNIKLRRREIAMLKSVGLTPGGVQRMLRYESLFYGLTALLYGLPLGIALSVFIYYQFGDGVGTFAFRLPWGAIAACVLGILAIVFATMMVSGAMIRNDNIVDTLKEENL